jgi:hypothetical protein
LVLAHELEHRQAAHDVVSTWFPWCITASTLKWDFGQAAHLRLANKDSPGSLLGDFAALREILPF